MKKIISFTLIAVLLVSCFTFAVSAESKVHFRIEGKGSTYFNRDVVINGTCTVLDVLKQVSDTCEEVNATIEESQYGAYISAINGDEEATIEVPNEQDPENPTTYYIGWMFAIDNIPANSGASSTPVYGGQDVVLYYADMYCQVPVMDSSEKGKLKFTSYDWLPDWSGMGWMPVAGAKVVLNNHKEYTSDADGVVTFDPSEFRNLVNVQISKSDELGYPLVCRFEDNFGFDSNKPEVKPVTFNYKTSLYVKGTYQIDLSTEEDVTYTTSDSNIATVSESGKITALKAGTAAITATSGKTTAVYKVTVKNPTLNATKKTLKKGKSFTLKVTGSIGTVKYSTNKKSVATVSSKGKVTAKKKGKAVITVKANGVTLKCNVTVK